jgi:hypothetical protein
MRAVDVRKASQDDLGAVLALNKKLFDKEIAEYDPLLDGDWTFSENGREWFGNIIATQFCEVAEVVGGA